MSDESTATPKNVVYIMLDDADFFDFGFLMSLLPQEARDAVTPNIDALRTGGRMMTQFYDASAACTPTRVSVMTGDAPMEYGANIVWGNFDSLVQGSGMTQGLPNDVPLLGHLMQSLGLSTGHFGKWHIGLSRPEYGHQALGFEDFGYYDRPPLDVGETANWNDTFRFVTDTGTYLRDTYIDREFGDQVIDFVQREVQEEGGFFLNWWPLSPHFPWTPPTDFDNSLTNFDLSTDRGKLLAMIYTIDQQIGLFI